MPRLATPADNLTDRVLAAARYITPRFWTGDVSSFADLLDQNVVFASIASRTFIYGKRDVSLRIAEIARVYRENGKIQLHDERYNVRELNDGLCMATARYLCAIEHLGDSLPGRRRSFYVLSSMTWRRASNEFGCELLLCHNSERSLMSRLVDDLPTSSGERLALPMTADALSRREKRARLPMEKTRKTFMYVTKASRPIPIQVPPPASHASSRGRKRMEQVWTSSVSFQTLSSKEAFRMTPVSRAFSKRRRASAVSRSVTAVSAIVLVKPSMASVFIKGRIVLSFPDHFCDVIDLQ
jgi:hypothetical protein